MSTDWFPSRYGAGDEAGALNEIGPDNVVRAASLVRQARVFDLAHVLDDRIPAFPGRSVRKFLTTKPARRVGRNEVNWIVEHGAAPSQIGTHVDDLNHLHAGERRYNGHRFADVICEHGTTKLGIETLPQVVTRGLLLNIAAGRGVERLGAGEVITPADAGVAGLLQATVAAVHRHGRRDRHRDRRDHAGDERGPDLRRAPVGARVCADRPGPGPPPDDAACRADC